MFQGDDLEISAYYILEISGNQSSIYCEMSLQIIIVNLFKYYFR